MKSVQEYLENGVRTDFGKVEKEAGFRSSLQTRVACDSKMNTIQAIKNGMLEKSIINISRYPNKTIHPTQKPVRLLERLLNLVTVEGDKVLDPFSGSASTAIACLNTNRESIGYEIDEEYFVLGQFRLYEAILKHETNHQK